MGQCRAERTEGPELQGSQVKLDDRWKAFEEQDNVWPLVRWAAKWLLFLVVTVTLLRIVCWPLVFASKVAQVVTEQIDPHVLLQRYEWFKDAHAALDQKLANIGVYRQREARLERAYGPNRLKWPADERERYDIWESELSGVVASYNELAATYNAQMAKINYRFTNRGMLPQGATETFPREYAPYNQGETR